MGTNRVERRLGDLIEVRHGFAFKGAYFRESPPGDVLVTPGNFAIGGGFKADKLKFYDGPVPSEFVLSAGDLLITMTDLSKAGDTLGYPARVPAAGGNRYLHNQRLGRVLVTRPEQLNEAYLYYLLCSPAYRQEIVAGATGSTVKHTSPTRIAEVRVSLPGIEEQRRIAWVLGALDDKVAYNSDLSTSLAAMAEMTYIGATRVVDRHVSLAELAEHRKGTVRPTDHPTLLFEHFSIPAFDTGMRAGLVRGEQLKSGKTPIGEDCVLISKLNPRWHRVWWPRPSGAGEPVCSPEFVMLTPRSPIPVPYLHTVLRFDRGLRQHVLGHATGTTGSRQRIRPSDLLKARISVPRAEALAELVAIVEPIFELEAQLLDESNTLRDVRQALLPKLIAGEVSVRGAAYSLALTGDGNGQPAEIAEIAGTTS